MTRWSLVLAPVLVAAIPACNVITKDLLGGTNPDTPITPADAALDSVNPTTQMLVLHYGFEDTSGTTVTDSSSRALNATLSDPSMSTANGRTGRGIQMTGAAPAIHYVTLPSGALNGVEDFTIAVWVKLASNPIWARIYDFGNGLPDPQNRFMYLTTSGFMGPTGDGLHASSYGGSAANESVLATGTYLPTNVWKHIAITGAGGQRRIYIDGFPAANLENGPAIAPREMEPVSPNSWLGRSRFTADSGFPGTMDEFRIYSRVLTAAEIADLAWPKRDYAHWRFDESTGTAAQDTSDFALATSLANNASWSTGRLGGAVAFTGGPGAGAGPHVVIAGNPLQGCTNQLTIAMWLRISQFATNSRAFDFGTGTTHSLYLSPNDGTGMHVGMKSPNGTFDMATTTPPVPADSIWHHVALTMDMGNTVVLYVDGMPVRTQPSPNVRPSDFANLSELYLAKSRNNDPYFNGAIDELRIACRAFTPDEIRNLSRP